MNLSKLIEMKLALIAEAAYIKDFDKLKESVTDILGEHIEIKTMYIESVDLEAVIIKWFKDTTIIAFAGTESWSDLFLDMQCVPTNYRYGGKIHNGFSKICDSLVDPLRNEMICDDKLSFESGGKIYCVGHSLGGATALVAADIINFVFSGVYDISARTYGCPNGWTKEARELYETRIKDVIHYDNFMDYVTILLDLTTDLPHENKKVHVYGGFGHKMKKYIRGIQKL